MVKGFRSKGSSRASFDADMGLDGLGILPMDYASDLRLADLPVSRAGEAHTLSIVVHGGTSARWRIFVCPRLFIGCFRLDGRIFG